jgi:hypothetical protein
MSNCETDEQRARQHFLEAQASFWQSVQGVDQLITEIHDIMVMPEGKLRSDLLANARSALDFAKSVHSHMEQEYVDARADFAAATAAAATGSLLSYPFTPNAFTLAAPPYSFAAI